MLEAFPSPAFPSAWVPLHRGTGELWLSPGTLQASSRNGPGLGCHWSEEGEAGECKGGERPREGGCHKSKDLRTQGTSGSLFRLKCVCEALLDSGCKGGGDLAAALVSLLVGIFL